MGSGISGFSVNNTPGQTQEALTLSLQLGYTRSDVNRLYRAFRKMDTCKTGSISLRSYCAVNKISTAFGELIFRRMLRLGNDVDRDLTFKDYLLSSWNALSIFDNDSISVLTFQIFDVDDSCKRIGSEHFGFNF
jgi:Ca2+-binding EF-hand superfamily protein